MIENLLTNSLFVTIGSIAAVIITLAIFKKLFKVVLYIILLVVAVAVYVINTGEDPKALIDTAQTTVKDLKKDINKVKKAAASTVEKIDDAVPKDAKRSLNKVSKTVNKTLKEKKKAVKTLEKELKKHRKELGD